MSQQTILFIGASRGCGFYALLHVLRAGGRATLLLRNPDTVLSNPEFQALLPEQRERTTLVKGDAFVSEDVARAVDAAGPEMNTVIFSLGVRPSSLPKITWGRGFILDPPKPCARAITNLLSVLQDLDRPGLRLVIISSMGIGEKHKELPWLLKGFYGWLLYDAHEDKDALEYLSLRSSKYPTPSRAPPEGSLPTAAAAVRSDWLDELIILRPAFFTDGRESAPGKLRTAAALKGAYTVSRRDVGRFIAQECLKPEMKWVGAEGVVLAY